MKVAAFVPIKLNSERLPRKNILSFENGKPLMRYIQDTLLQVANIDEIYVYCSDDGVREYVSEGVQYLKRSEHLDRSETPFNEVLSSFAQEVEADYYVLTHATAPFIKSESIRIAVEQVRSEIYDSVVGVQRVNEFLWRDRNPLNFTLDNIPRTQDLPCIYAETCGLYVYSRDAILKENRRIGTNPYFLELSKIESTDINDYEDFVVANAIYNNIAQGG